MILSLKGKGEQDAGSDDLLKHALRMRDTTVQISHSIK